MIAVTERAAEVVAQAEAAARRFDPEARIRLVRAGDGVRFELTDRPLDGDDTVACEGATLFVEPGIEGTLDCGDHNAPSLIA